MLTSLLLYICKHRFNNAYWQVFDCCGMLVRKNGYAGNQIFRRLATLIMHDARISEIAKAKASLRLAQAEFALKKGADEYMQVFDVASSLSVVFLLYIFSLTIFERRYAYEKQYPCHK